MPSHRPHLLQLILAVVALRAQPSVASGSATSESADEYRAIVQAHPDTAHGRTLFETCMRCHGANAAGAADGSVPALAGQHVRVIAHQLVDYRHDERWDGRMEHFADFPYLVFAQDVADVAGYINGLERTGPRVQGPGDYVDHGQRAYAHSCASCHGAHGEGDAGKAYPRLAGQHYPYLVRQMHDALEGRRPNFSRAHVKLLSRFERDDIEGVADYLSRMPP